MTYIQKCKQRQWEIYNDVTKAMRYIQRGKQMLWDVYEDVNKGNEIYTKM